MRNLFALANLITAAVGAYFVVKTGNAEWAAVTVFNFGAFLLCMKGE